MSSSIQGLEKDSARENVSRSGISVLKGLIDFLQIFCFYTKCLFFPKCSTTYASIIYLQFGRCFHKIGTYVIVLTRDGNLLAIHHFGAE